MIMIFIKTKQIIEVQKEIRIKKEDMIEKFYHKYKNEK